MATTAADLQAATAEAIASLPPELRAFAPGTSKTNASAIEDVVIHGTAGLAPDILPVDFEDYARRADQFISQPAEQIRSVATDYLGRFVSQTVSAALEAAFSAGGLAIGTAVCPGLGSAAGAVVGVAVNGIIGELTKQNRDPFVENDGGWIPEVEHVLDQWCVKPSDVPRPDGGYDGYWNHDRNLTRTTWDGGPLNGITTPWTIRRWIGDCLHNMSKTGGPGMGLGSLLGSSGLADPRDNAHAGWGADWWIDPSFARDAWQERFVGELYGAVAAAARRRASEASARAQVVARALAIASKGPLTNSDRLRAALRAGKASITTGVRVATLADYVAFYLGGGTLGRVPPPPPDIAVAAPVQATSAAALRASINIGTKRTP